MKLISAIKGALRYIHVVFRVDVCPTLQQQLTDSNVAFIGGVVEGSVVAAAVDVKRKNQNTGQMPKQAEASYFLSLACAPMQSAVRCSATSTRSPPFAALKMSGLPAMRWAAAL